MPSEVEDMTSKIDGHKIPALYAAVAVLQDRVSGLVDAIRRMHSSNEAQFTRVTRNWRNYLNTRCKPFRGLIHDAPSSV